MLIYLKGINSVQLQHLLDFIYNGEASVGQEELKDFLDTGKELMVKGLECDVSAVGKSTKKEQIVYLHETEEFHENKQKMPYDAEMTNIEEIQDNEEIQKKGENYEIKGNITSEVDYGDKLESSSKNYIVEAITTKTNKKKVPRDKNIDLDRQIWQMIEQFDIGWICKVCGKTMRNKGHIKEHAEYHIEGMSHACNICSKTYSSRKSLREHIIKHERAIFPTR